MENEEDEEDDEDDPVDTSTAIDLLVESLEKSRTRIRSSWQRLQRSFMSRNPKAPPLLFALWA